MIGSVSSSSDPPSSWLHVGLVILLGICAGDDIHLAQRLAAKACKLRLWDAR